MEIFSIYVLEAIFNIELKSYSLGVSVRLPYKHTKHVLRGAHFQGRQIFERKKKEEKWEKMGKNEKKKLY